MLTNLRNVNTEKYYNFFIEFMKHGKLLMKISGSIIIINVNIMLVICVQLLK